MATGFLWPWQGGVEEEQEGQGDFDRLFSPEEKPEKPRACDGLGGEAGSPRAQQKTMGNFYNLVVARARLLAGKPRQPENPSTTVTTTNSIENTLVPEVVPPPRKNAREAAEQARRDILSVCPPERRALPGRVEPLCAAERLSAGLDCDEVLPGLVLASGKTVKTVAYMRELRVTHIINTASRDVWLPVEKLSNMGVDLFQFHVDDVPSANIAPFFRPVADMVSRAQQSGGLLVVNCLVGLSRSATVLAAALMILHHWSLARTLTTLRLRRQVKPNLGFMAQLITLEMKLKNQGHRLS